MRKSKRKKRNTAIIGKEILLPLIVAKRDGKRKENLKCYLIGWRKKEKEMKKTEKIGRIFLAGLLIIAAVVMATGRASSGIGRRSVDYSSENSVETLKKALAENKTINYKIVYCEMGWLNWNLIFEPMAVPDAVTIEAGEVLTKKVGEIFEILRFY